MLQDEPRRLELAAVRERDEGVRDLERRHLVGAERERGRRPELRLDAERARPADDVRRADLLEQLRCGVVVALGDGEAQRNRAGRRARRRERPRRRFGFSGRFGNVSTLAGVKRREESA